MEGLENSLEIGAGKTTTARTLAAWGFIASVTNISNEEIETRGARLGSVEQSSLGPVQEQGNVMHTSRTRVMPKLEATAASG